MSDTEMLNFLRTVKRHRDRLNRLDQEERRTFLYIAGGDAGQIEEAFEFVFDERREKERANENDVARVVEAYRMIERGWPEATEEQKADWLKNLAVQSGIGEQAIRKQMQIQEIEAMQ